MRPGAGLCRQQRHDPCRVDLGNGAAAEHPLEDPDRRGVLIQDLHRLVAQSDRHPPGAERRSGAVGVGLDEHVAGLVGLARLVAHRVEPGPRQVQRRGDAGKQLADCGVFAPMPTAGQFSATGHQRLASGATTTTTIGLTPLVQISLPRAMSTNVTTSYIYGVRRAARCPPA